jgi:hypothetical protein
MLAHKFVFGLVGITAVVGGAVAMARSSPDANISRFSKTQPLAATCPKIDWPYGCEWRPQTLGTKHLSVRKGKHNRLYMSFLG